MYLEVEADFDSLVFFLVRVINEVVSLPSSG